MLILVENVITDGLCYSINKYAKANNKYIKDYDTSKESSYLKYLDVSKFVWLGNITKIDRKWI